QEAVALWQAEFWNRQLGRVYTFGTEEPVGLPESLIKVNPVNGELTTADPAAQRDLETTRDFVSDSGAQGANTTSDVHTPFALYVTEPPPRIASSSSGIAADGWMSSDATFTNFAGGRGGRVAVVLSRAAWRGPDVPGHVKVTVARRRGVSLGKPTAISTFTIHSGKTRKLLLPAPAGPYTVSVQIAPTFSPSQFGQSDTRQLGATVYFAPAPGQPPGRWSLECRRRANRRSLPDDAEIAAVFERLRGEVGARAPADRPATTPSGPRADGSPSMARDQAERFWAVTA